MKVDVHLAALHLDLVDEPELDEVEPQLGVDHVGERVLDVVDGWHGATRLVASAAVRSLALIALFIVAPARGAVRDHLKVGRRDRRAARRSCSWRPIRWLGALAAALAGTGGLAALQRRRSRRAGCPHREVIDGVLVIFGGAFLITPGLHHRRARLILLLPPTRALVRRSACARSAGARRRCARRRTAGREPRLRRRRHRHRARAAARSGSSGERRRASRSPSSTPRRELYGTARSGTTLLFDGRRRPRRIAEGPDVERERRRLARRLADRLELELEPRRREARARTASATRICAVNGRVGRHARSTASAPSPRRASRPRGRSSTRSARSRRCSTTSTRVLALARRPRGAPGPRRRARDARC